jgi:hypothetical protein
MSQSSKLTATHDRGHCPGRQTASADMLTAIGAASEVSIVA